MRHLSYIATIQFTCIALFHLNRYCLKVIDNDEVLFKEASMALNKSGNNTDIEVGRKCLSIQYRTDRIGY